MKHNCARFSNRSLQYRQSLPALQRKTVKSETVVEQKDMEHEPPIFPHWIKTTLVAVLIAGSALFYYNQKQIAQQEAKDRLTSIARLKATQIATWRAEESKLRGQNGKLRRDGFRRPKA